MPRGATRTQRRLCSALWKYSVAAVPRAAQFTPTVVVRWVVTSLCLCKRERKIKNKKTITGIIIDRRNRTCTASSAIDAVGLSAAVTESQFVRSSRSEQWKTLWAVHFRPPAIHSRAQTREMPPVPARQPPALLMQAARRKARLKGHMR